MTTFTREERKIISAAKKILLQKSRQSSDLFESPQAVKNYLQLHCAPLENEVFGIVMLDTKHRLIGIKQLFTGTIDGASVYPREIVKACLKANCAALIIYHNHPSGVVEPSRADEVLTDRIKEALKLVDVRLLDHFIVGYEGILSFAETGRI